MSTDCAVLTRVFTGLNLPDSCCAWRPADKGNITRIECDANGRITSINLNDQQIYAPIPTDIGSLTMVRSLYLANNHFSGSIPASLATLRNLQVLSLADNELTGAIPSGLELAFANLTSSSVFLESNFFNSSLPSWVSRAASKTVSYNCFTAVEDPESYNPSTGTLNMRPVNACRSKNGDAQAQPYSYIPGSGSTSTTTGFVSTTSTTAATAATTTPSRPTTTTGSFSAPSTSGPSTAVIAGVATGIVVFLATLAAIVAFFFVKRRRDAAKRDPPTVVAVGGAGFLPAADTGKQAAWAGAPNNVPPPVRIDVGQSPPTQSANDRGYYSAVATQSSPVPAYGLPPPSSVSVRPSSEAKSDILFAVNTPPSRPVSQTQQLTLQPSAVSSITPSYSVAEISPRADDGARPVSLIFEDTKAPVAPQRLSVAPPPSDTGAESGVREAVVEWTADRVVREMSEMGLSKDVATILEANNISGKRLLGLTADELESFGITNYKVRDLVLLMRDRILAYNGHVPNVPSTSSSAPVPVAMPMVAVPVAGMSMDTLARGAPDLTPYDECEILHQIVPAALRSLLKTRCCDPADRTLLPFFSPDDPSAIPDHKDFKSLPSSENVLCWSYTRGGRINLLRLRNLDLSNANAEALAVTANATTVSPLTYMMSGLARLDGLVHLDLTNSSISGSFYASNDTAAQETVRLPPALDTLSLAQNKLFGPLPNTAVTSLTRLETLFLSENQFTGRIPANYSVFFEPSSGRKALRRFEISFNKLDEGSLPNSVWQSPTLEYLGAARSNLTGEIPATLTPTTLVPQPLSNLTFMLLHSNKLQGALPSWLLQLPKLTDLYLSQNLFTGTADGWILGAIKALTPTTTVTSATPTFTFGPVRQVSVPLPLRNLDVSSNRISGILPSAFAVEWNNIETINFSRNNISGNIPGAFWSQWVNITRINLAFNNLTGPYPTEYPRQSLVDVDLSNNYLTGAITMPASPQRFVKFNLANNFLTGKLPLNMVNGTAATFIDLSNNAFNGSFPDEWLRVVIGDFMPTETSLLPTGTGFISLLSTSNAVLNYFNVSKNRLVGAVPSMIALAPTIDLSRNCLILPTDLAKAFPKSSADRLQPQFDNCTEPTPPSGGNGPPIPIIAGATAAGFVVLALALSLFFFLRRRHTRTEVEKTLRETSVKLQAFGSSFQPKDAPSPPANVSRSTTASTAEPSALSSSNTVSSSTAAASEKSALAAVYRSGSGSAGSASLPGMDGAGMLFAGMSNGLAPRGPTVDPEQMAAAELSERDAKPSFLFGGVSAAEVSATTATAAAVAGMADGLPRPVLSGELEEPDAKPAVKFDASEKEAVMLGAGTVPRSVTSPAAGPGVPGSSALNLLREEESLNWGTEEVGRWLEASGINNNVIQMFKASGVTGPLLLALDDNTLARMGFEKEEIRNMLLLMVYALRNKRQTAMGDMLDVPPAYEAPPKAPDAVAPVAELSPAELQAEVLATVQNSASDPVSSVVAQVSSVSMGEAGPGKEAQRALVEIAPAQTSEARGSEGSFYSTAGSEAVGVATSS
ncbi:hypothetical protein HDU96_009315 [Phlyctochytrium bullatum]|nr:hypothetical protein HDU96_009315 [Phlyctochytrium bullatum]